VNTGNTPDAREGTPLKFLTVVPHDKLSWEEVIVMQTIQIIIFKNMLGLNQQAESYKIL
jgi:hypothetical protein